MDKRVLKVEGQESIHHVEGKLVDSCPRVRLMDGLDRSPYSISMFGGVAMDWHCANGERLLSSRPSRNDFEDQGFHSNIHSPNDCTLTTTNELLLYSIAPTNRKCR